MPARSYIKDRRQKPVHPASESQLEVKLVPILAVLFLVFYGLSGFRGWLIFGTGLLGVWLVAAIWVGSLKRGLRVERKIHYAWARVGDSVPEEIVITNKSRLPALWVEVIDESDSLVDPIRLVTDVEARSSRRRHPIHNFKWRGLYALGPTRLRTGDPFGIYSLTLYDQQISSILVTPPQLALSQIHIVPGGWSGDRQRHVPSVEREISDAGLREYAPGDSLRRIHWRASAHNDSLIVRQLESATSADWWIIVDLERSAQAGTGQDTTLELLVVLAASLASRGLREHRRVGLALAGPKLILQEPRSGSSHRWTLLRSLAMANFGERNLAQILRLVGIRPTASLIVITSSSDPAFVAAFDRNHKHGGVTILLVNPCDFGGITSQKAVSAALRSRGIVQIQIPRSLLEDAYTKNSRDKHRYAGGTGNSQRYMERARSAWQRMD
jgi:uncharacterized protein (DUF58 family)